MITSVLLFSLMAASPGPTMRLYEPHARHYLDNVIADPSVRAPGEPLEGVGLSVLTYGGNIPATDTEPANDQLDRACAEVLRARANGIDAHPGMRVYYAHPVETLITREWWEDRANDLAALKACVGDDKIVALDIEDYVHSVTGGGSAILDVVTLATHGLTPGGLISRMRGFLFEVSTLVVNGYPLNVNDVAHGAIMDAAAARYAWDESSFEHQNKSTTDVLLSNPDTYGSALAQTRQVATAYRARWNDVRIESGQTDDIIRQWGFRLRERAYSDFGPFPFWVFRGPLRYDSNGSRASNIGSRAWVEGTLFDSRNNVENAWRVAIRLAPIAREPAMGSELKRVFVTGGLDNDTVEVTDDGFALVPNGSTYDLYHGTTPDAGYAVATTWRVKSLDPNTSHRAVWGSAKDTPPPGTPSGTFYDWWVEVQPTGPDQYTLELAIRAPPANSSTTRHTIATGQVVGQVYRQTASVGVDSIHFDTVSDGPLGEVDGGALLTNVLDKPCICDGQRLRFGQPIGLDSPGGEVSFADDVVFWGRELTPEESARNVIGETYPWDRR